MRAGCPVRIRAMVWEGHEDEASLGAGRVCGDSTVSRSKGYRDATRPASERARHLLACMTLEEKIAQLCSCWSADVITRDRGVTHEACQARIPHGIGHVARPAVCAGPVGATQSGGFEPAGVAAAINAVQRFLVEETRLGIPAIVHEESLSGVTMRRATMFPQAINYASTWNPQRVEQVAATIREQMRAVGLRQSLSPLLDVGRDPRWGRTEETFGEDPCLVAAIGCAYVRGLQGRDLRKGVAATGKHFVGYGVPEGGHNVGAVRLGPRELREVHAFPFEAAIRDAGLASVMHAYHEIDGIPCVASRELLTGLLRDELGFEGVVVSDYGALWMLHDAHRVAADKAEATVLALTAGLDVEIPDAWGYGPSLLGLVREGRLPEALVDRSAFRVLRLKFLLGLFEKPYVDERRVRRMRFDAPGNRRLARQAAVESLVLLKNTGGVLPLQGCRRLAVIGPNAARPEALLGDYTYANHTQLAFESVPVASVFDAIRTRAPEGCTVEHVAGCDIREPGEQGFRAAERAARRADAVIAVLGETSFAWSGENRDRTSVALPAPQERLLRRLHAAGKPVVVVILGGRPLSTFAVEDCCEAVLQAWYPGEEGGGAIAAVLFGDVSPEGRLPVSVPKDAGHIPCHYSRRPFSAAGGSVETGPIRAHYPFGHGLTYTSFSYSNLRLPGRVRAGGRVAITLDVANTGKREGTEVVQLYTRDPMASVSRPILELKGFVRVTLAAGATARVTFDLPLELLAFLGVDGGLVIEPGVIEVKLGASSGDIRLEGKFEIVGRVCPVARRTATMAGARVRGRRSR